MTSKFTITKERIKDIIARIEMYGHGAGYTADEVHEMACMMLAAMDSKPKFEVNVGGNTWVECSEQAYENAKERGDITREFYVSPLMLPVMDKQPAVVALECSEIISELEQVLDWILNFLPVPTPLTIPNARRLANVINVCRAAMLQNGNFRENDNPSTNNCRKIAETSTNHPAIPDSSIDMLRRWLIYGRSMQNAGSRHPRNLIAETEAMLQDGTLTNEGTKQAGNSPAHSDCRPAQNAISPAQGWWVFNSWDKGVDYPKSSTPPADPQEQRIADAVELLKQAAPAMLADNSGPNGAQVGRLKPPATPGCWCHTCRPVTMDDMRLVVCPECGNKRCPKANDHRNTCSGSNEPGQEGSAYPADPAGGAGGAGATENSRCSGKVQE